MGERLIEDEEPEDGGHHRYKSLTCRRNQSSLNPEKSNFSSLSTIKTEANIKENDKTAPSTWLHRMADHSVFLPRALADRPTFPEKLC